MKLTLTLLFGAILLQASAQQTTDNKWDLQRCVDYAMKNNISVKQADVQARLAALQVKQAKWYQYPTAAFNTGLGGQFGRSIDRTTNVYSDIQAIYQNFQVTSNTQLYNFGRLKANVEFNQLSALAALADVEKAANDASLNVCVYYLQVLSSKEQIEIAHVQIEQSRAQLEITRKQVNAGSLPELNLVELEAQLANDSSTYISAQGTYDQNVLTLKATLNLDAAAPFEVDTPPVDKIPLLPFAELQPEVVYQLALVTQPLQKGNDLRIKAADKSIKMNKAQLYPTLGLGVSLTSNFYSAFKNIDVNNISVTGYQPNGSVVNVGGTNYLVQDPVLNYPSYRKSFSQLWDGWGTQLSNNFGQGVGLSLSVPIFNNGQYRISYEQSKLNYKTALLNKEQADLTLKNNIYTAYSNAITSLQKFYAGRKNVESNQKAYDFAFKRYGIGLLGTIDLITNQNNLLKAKLQQVSNQYDYVFKMKLLEFYRGQGLKLQ
ncbi:TolC family protein [Chitinophagaceae bacterium LWZ2-11]